MIDPCCPPPDDIDPLLDRAQYLVDAGRAERAAANEARETNRRCSNTHHTFAGYQNGQPLIQSLGGKPYPARGRMITNASVVRGAPVQVLGCGARINQMTRRRGVAEEPVTPDQVFWFVYGVGGATFVNSAIALGQTSIQIDYLNGDGCGGSVNPTQYGLAIGVLDLQSAKTLSFSFSGAAQKFRESSNNELFEALIYRIDQPGTPTISDIASYRAFVEVPPAIWYTSAALISRMSLVALANPAIVPSPATPLLSFAVAPFPVGSGNPAPPEDVGFYLNGVETITGNVRDLPPPAGSGNDTISDSVATLMASNPCTPIALETTPHPSDINSKVVIAPGRPSALAGVASFPAAIALTPGKYLIHLSSQLFVNSQTLTNRFEDSRIYSDPDPVFNPTPPPSVPGFTLYANGAIAGTGTSWAAYRKFEPAYFGTYNASNFMRMSVSGL